MSQQQVADILGVERSTYSFYETGKSKPRIKFLLALCKIYKVTLNEMLNLEPIISQSGLVPDYQANQVKEIPLTQYEQNLFQFVKQMDNYQFSQVMKQAAAFLDCENKKQHVEKAKK